jgi:indole-3-glycerol phosphate synthase
VTLVAASGLKSRAEVERYQAAGIHAFLIGEALVTSPNPGERLREFIEK